jgi:hypothetical protein
MIGERLLLEPSRRGLAAFGVVRLKPPNGVDEILVDLPARDLSFEKLRCQPVPVVVESRLAQRLRPSRSICSP